MDVLSLVTCTLAAWVSRHECRHPIGDASEDVAADSSSEAGRTGTAMACVLRLRPHEQRCQDGTGMGQGWEHGIGMG